ncbi:hypothetical protein ACS0TY_005186 [Phlomoides rotata]
MLYPPPLRAHLPTMELTPQGLQDYQAQEQSSSSTSIQGTRQDRFMFPYPTQWGTPTFAVGHSIAMTSDVLLPMVEGPAIFRNGLYGAYLMAN